MIKTVQKDIKENFKFSTTKNPLSKYLSDYLYKDYGTNDLIVRHRAKFKNYFLERSPKVNKLLEFRDQKIIVSLVFEDILLDQFGKIIRIFENLKEILRDQRIKKRKIKGKMHFPR